MSPGCAGVLCLAFHMNRALGRVTAPATTTYAQPTHPYCCLLVSVSVAAGSHDTLLASHSSQSGTESLILSPSHFVLQTIRLLWRTRATIHCAHDSLLPEDLHQHPLPPSAVKTHKIRSHVPKTSANAQSSRRDVRWLRRPPRLRLAAHAASGARRPPVPSSRTGACQREAWPVRLWNRSPDRPGLRAGVVVDEHTRSNVRQYNTLHSIYKGQRPLYHIPLPRLKTSAAAALLTDNVLAKRVDAKGL
jgi:hypothetical protein